MLLFLAKTANGNSVYIIASDMKKAIETFVRREGNWPMSIEHSTDKFYITE